MCTLVTKNGVTWHSKERATSAALPTGLNVRSILPGVPLQVAEILGQGARHDTVAKAAAGVSDTRSEEVAELATVVVLKFYSSRSTLHPIPTACIPVLR